MKLRAVLVVSSVVVTIALLASADGTKLPSTSTVAPKTCGEGACKRTVPATQTCTPGQPITTNDGWLLKRDDATGSWDANCDGTVEKKPVPNDIANGPYVTGCELYKTDCAPKPRAEYACGDEQLLFEKCVYAKIGDARPTCKPGGSLKGKYVQPCR